jgi:hypothetical protein
LLRPQTRQERGFGFVLAVAHTGADGADNCHRFAARGHSDTLPASDLPKDLGKLAIGVGRRDLPHLDAPGSANHYNKEIKVRRQGA